MGDTRIPLLILDRLLAEQRTELATIVASTLGDAAAELTEALALTIQ